MAQLLGLIAAATVATALVMVCAYGLVTIVWTALVVTRPRSIDPLAEELDSFLAGLLGPRDQAVGQPAATPEGHRRPRLRRSARRNRR